MVDSFVFGWLFVVGLVVLVPLFLLIGLVVALSRGRNSRPSSSPAPPGPPPPSMDQRTVSLERSLSRYNEERSRILGMLEKGTISPEEADRLFATLDRETSTMACPYCGGDVRIEAIRCKHCRRDLVAGVDMEVVLLRVHPEVLEAPGDGILVVGDVDLVVDDVAGVGDPLAAGHELVPDVPPEAVAHAPVPACEADSGLDGVPETLALLIGDLSLGVDGDDQRVAAQVGVEVAVESVADGDYESLLLQPGREYICALFGLVTGPASPDH